MSASGALTTQARLTISIWKLENSQRLGLREFEGPFSVLLFLLILLRVDEVPMMAVDVYYCTGFFVVRGWRRSGTPLWLLLTVTKAVGRVALSAGVARGEEIRSFPANHRLR